MSKSNIKIDNPTWVQLRFYHSIGEEDIEQRIGLTGGRFTRANTFFTFIVCILATFYEFVSMCWNPMMC